MFELIFSVLIALVIGILAIAILFPVGLFKLFFGHSGSQQSHWHTQQRQQQSQQSGTPSNDKKKIFDHTDGEYVDFEEIKE
jgi:hypothetical protein